MEVILFLDFLDQMNFQKLNFDKKFENSRIYNFENLIFRLLQNDQSALIICNCRTLRLLSCFRSFDFWSVENSNL